MIALRSACTAMTSHHIDDSQSFSSLAFVSCRICNQVLPAFNQSLLVSPSASARARLTCTWQGRVSILPWESHPLSKGALIVEVREVGHKVLHIPRWTQAPQHSHALSLTLLHDIGVRQGLNLDGSRAGLDVKQTREAVLPVDVHGLPRSPAPELPLA